MNGFIQGVWSTDAPINPDQVEKMRQRLNELAKVELPGVQVKECEVWVDGVLWEYRDIETFR